ncbi:MAG: aldehyde dehydrogenase family protein [Bradymonadia bacterium]
MDILNPATGAVIETVVADTETSIREKLAAAHTAQVAWAQTALETRVSIIARFRALLDEQADALAATQTAETGKPITQARNEILATGPRIDFFLQNIAEAMQPVPAATAAETGGTEEQVTYEPLGVVVNISAWNYPWFVGTNVYVPALLTGSAVLYKPSENSTLTGLHMARLMAEAGLPEGLFTPIVGGGEVGAALLDAPVDAVFFTGSHGTGVKVARAAASQLAHLQLELGGKDPLYVCDDVDVAAVAASAADGAFYNAGQSCCAVERIYVHQAIYDAFVEAFTAEVKGFVVGEPTEEGTYLGPLARGAQIPVLTGQVEDAVSKGARLCVEGGAADRPGHWFNPVVLADVNHTMDIMVEESFGPVIGIQKVTDDAEAVELMNDTRYGLTAAVFTPDRERAEGLLRTIKAGSVYWNCCDRVSPRMPWTGRGDSGVGSTLGLEGIRTFLVPRSWHLRAPA